MVKPVKALLANRTPARALDQQFAQWLVSRFAQGMAAVDVAILQALAEAVSHAVYLKHTCVDLRVYPALREPALDNLLQGISAGDVQRLVTPAILPLRCTGDGQRIWLQKYHAFEQAVAMALQQRRAAGKLEIITGGPGTGKTWTASQRIQQALQDQPQARILLAAPTGKAANTMMQALARSGFTAEAHGLRGLTLHALLGLRTHSPKPRHHAGHPLVCDLLVVDEASMIDLPMMYRLLAATPLTAHVLLLGDKDQLASVEAGSVLGDICQALAGDACITSLSHSRRYQDSPEIGVLAEALNAGTVPDLSANRQVHWHALSPLQPWQPGWLQQALPVYREWQQHCSSAEPLAMLQQQQQFQLLCALREGPHGVSGINAMIEQALGQKPGSWYAGKPVMVTRNDHERKLYNGDVGMVLPMADGSLKACFQVDGAVKAVSLAQMPPHDTCYAITVHKSQGSEYERILVVLPARREDVEANPVLTRELVYTAATRARSCIDLWCGEEVLALVAGRTLQRMSGLGEALAGAGAQ